MLLFWICAWLLLQLFRLVLWVLSGAIPMCPETSPPQAANVIRLPAFAALTLGGRAR